LPALRLAHSALEHTGREVPTQAAAIHAASGFTPLIPETEGTTGSM
jgi:hypothetical protein